VVLTIAGFDPSSGAGITADIKTIAAHGCYGIAAITAMTVQSAAGVRQVSPVDPRLLTDTLDELVADVKISAVHIGVLGSGEIAARVAQFLEKAKPAKVVLDPILKSSSGASLLDEAGIRVLKERLLPLATVITPNIHEATALTGLPIENVDDMKLAAQRLRETGALSVVVTGGHLETAIDLLSEKGQHVQTFKSDLLPSTNTHGTGCAFSTAIACHLAQGRSLSSAVLAAKAYVTAAIATGYPVGKGVGPVNHLHMGRIKDHSRAIGMAKKLASGSSKVFPPEKLRMPPSATRCARAGWLRNPSSRERSSDPCSARRQGSRPRRGMRTTKAAADQASS
jgi:hydroxymethylpyrimidine/phosphomethylpyrimidine kinase